MRISFENIPRELALGAAEVSEILGLTIGPGGLPVEVIERKKGLSAAFSGGRASVGYSKRAEFYRALGLLAEGLRAGGDFEKSEEAAYDSVGLMLDNSRNAVLKPEAIRKMLRHMALMGHDMLMLYTEDTYEIPGYPYFGHMRGRFTAQEIRSLDEYARMLGIELVPCVQTLAHLNAAFRWPVFQELNDCSDILLVGEEKTYELIDAMLRSLSEMFSSRKIHLGMDEAHMLGLGKYLDRNGYRPRFDTMVEHLTRVISLCKKYGFEPMMWSDMFFRLTSSDYYSTSKIDEALLAKVPPEVSLVYWDYYTDKPALYDANIEKHQCFRNPLIFAGGAWKWTGMVPGNRFSFKTSRMALESCRRHGIRQVFVTAWGDDGGECSSFAILPVLQLFAEDCYASDTSDAHIDARLATCAGASLADFLDLDAPNLLPGNEAPGACSVNPSKYLLFQDPLCGLFDRQTAVGRFNGYYAQAARDLARGGENNPRWRYLFETLADLSRVLEIKCDLGLRIWSDYHAGDRAKLAVIAANDLPELLARVEKLHASVRRQWTEENKIFGLEVQDIRYGALKERLRETKKRLEAYLSGASDTLEELDADRLDVLCRPEGADMHVGYNNWKTIVSANIV